MIDWNDNAKAAVREFVECVDGGDYLSVSLFPLVDDFFESRPTQTKTVADSSQQSCSEGEKWTHEYGYVPCRIEIEKQDEHGYIVIYVQGDGYLSCEPDDIKPIKPKTTKAQAWDMLTDKNGEYYHTFNPWDKLLEVYEVIDD